MAEKNILNEELLSSWIKLTMTISNEKLVSDMPYNEAVICNILYRNNKSNPDRLLTATDLCRETRMLKSQMNRTLTSMEDKGLILRTRSKDDKRQIFVELNNDEIGLYVSQHSKILNLVDMMISHFGEDKIIEIIKLFDQISDIAEEVMK